MAPGQAEGDVLKIGVCRNVCGGVPVTAYVVTIVQRLSPLLPLVHAEIEDPHKPASDATEWKFLVCTEHQGGVLLRIDDDHAVIRLFALGVGRLKPMPNVEPEHLPLNDQMPPHP